MTEHHLHFLCLVISCSRLVHSQYSHHIELSGFGHSHHSPFRITRFRCNPWISWILLVSSSVSLTVSATRYETPRVSGLWPVLGQGFAVSHDGCGNMLKLPVIK